MFDFHLKFGRPSRLKVLSVNLIEDLVKEWKPEFQIFEIKELSGGFSNANFLVESKKIGKFICRVSSKGKDQLLLEKNISIRINNQVCPQVQHVGEKDGYSFAIVDYIEGELLSEVWQKLERPVIEKILLDLGDRLSQIHSVKFENSGFFDVNLNIKENFSKGVGTGYYDFIKSSLKHSLVISRLGADLVEAVDQIITKNLYKFEHVNGHKSLVHSDFNTKNILVSREKQCVTGVLDWEFAYSGTPLCDFGNFLRFEEEAGFEVSTFLTEGYGKTPRVFVKDWRKVAYLLDLASMFGFLIREDLHELTLNTSIRVIKNTIRHFKNN